MVRVDKRSTQRRDSQGHLGWAAVVATPGQIRARRQPRRRQKALRLDRYANEGALMGPRWYSLGAATMLKLRNFILVRGACDRRVRAHGVPAPRRGAREFAVGVRRPRRSPARRVPPPPAPPPPGPMGPPGWLASGSAAAAATAVAALAVARARREEFRPDKFDFVLTPKGDATLTPTTFSLSVADHDSGDVNDRQERAALVSARPPPPGDKNAAQHPIGVSAHGRRSEGESASTVARRRHGHPRRRRARAQRDRHRRRDSQSSPPHGMRWARQANRRSSSVSTTISATTSSP